MLGLRGDSPLVYLKSSLSQAFPSKPTFTEKDVADLSGKVSTPRTSIVSHTH